MEILSKILKFFRFFRCKLETDEEIAKRLLNLCEEGDYGLCSPPMENDIAIKELGEFFLGKDRYTELFLKSRNDFRKIVFEIKTKCQYDVNAEKGICYSPMDACDAIEELRKSLLGKDWCVITPVGPRQVNTEIVFEIERKYQRWKYMNFK